MSIKKGWRWLLLIALWGGPTLPTQAQTVYDLNVSFQPDRATLTGDATLTIQQDGTEPLKELYFRFDSGTQARVVVQEVTTPEGLVLPSRPYRYKYLDQEIEDPAIYQVFLAEALPPGQPQKIRFKYTLERIPRQGETTFLLDDVNGQGLGSWYPRMVRREAQQWKYQEHNVAQYQVSVQASEKFLILSSLPPLSVDKHYRYSADKAKGLDLVFAGPLLSRTQDVDGVQVRYYYPSSVQVYYKELMDVTNRVLAFYKQRYGVSPTNRLTMMVSDENGYSAIGANQMVVLQKGFALEKDRPKAIQALTEAIAYGIAQQFWGTRVSEDGTQVPWITQGLALYNASLFMQKQGQGFKLGERFLQQYLHASRQGWNTALNVPKVQLHHRPFNTFQTLAQGKGYSVMRMLELLVGRTAMENTERQLQKGFLNTFITAPSFQRSVQESAGKELDWFFRQWVRESWSLDYAVQSLQVTPKDTGGYRAVVVVQRIGQAMMPISIAVMLQNGEQVFRLWNGEKQSEQMTLDVSSMVQEVRIDPAGILPDIERINNVYRRQ